MLGSQPDRTALCTCAALQCSSRCLLNGTTDIMLKRNKQEVTHLMQRCLPPAAQNLQVCQPCLQSWSDGQQAWAMRCVCAACALSP